MGIRLEDIRIVHRKVGSKHVFTSPDVPELHVSHADEETALESIQSALDMIEHMKDRLRARKDVSDVRQERLYA
jgi:hypothetical protein